MPIDNSKSESALGQIDQNAGLDAGQAPLLDADAEVLQAESISLSSSVPLERAGDRLDVVVADLFPEFSRAKLQGWIKDESLLVNGRACKPKMKLAGGESLQLNATPEVQGEWIAEPMDLEIVYEDAHILVVNKPAGLVVHPAAGNYQGTLLNGLIHYNPSQRLLPRAGIVHRLDKDTTGLMVVAKTELAQTDLVRQMQARTVKRQYEAIVMGDVRQSGVVRGDIGRHPTSRTRMAVVTSGGKEAITHYAGLARYNGFTHLELQLETGRTHQIRVHMAHLGHPLVGDATYGKRLNAKAMRAQPDLVAVDQFHRQALHAAKLGLFHPESGEALQWQVPLPEDMSHLLALIKAAATS
ncbi:23S rRNA pseudouridine(1911/1915/1917) synthase RluD [Teredinibacter waterburyi]|uniref:23S rRNA pseudouridine(1911/1915/1917) synthase RluD n=1 Tax=Teredinibacter waterburyi TaxID=1500538 RepID=UPI00165FD158|nr:23S rRNA pseudouridine(1911/1915/1917) synthase RluD [Teredinibacter waterburyi]